jgi:hypothetical protein
MELPPPPPQAPTGGWLTSPLCAGLGVWGACAYGARAPHASEPELVAATLLSALLITTPALRSGIARRRLWVNAWMRPDARLTQLLQGGALYASLKLLAAFPWAVFLVAEVQHISPTQGIALTAAATLAALCREGLRRRFARLFEPIPASIFAREWATRLFTLFGALALIPLTLTQPRPSYAGLSLKAALLTSEDAERAVGAFGLLQDLSEVKEVSFWWALQNLSTLLSGAPERLIEWARWGLAGVYLLYTLSFLHALSRLAAAALELTDARARGFYAYTADAERP